MGSSNSEASPRAQRAAEARAAQERAERRRRLTMIGGVVAVMLSLVIGIVGFTLWQQNEKDERLEAAAGRSSDFGVAIGEQDAPHTVVVYEDFLCPFCADLEGATREDLARLAAEGEVRVEYRPFVLLSQLGDYSLRATNAFAVVLDAAGPEVAKEFHDLLFENQPPESDPGSVSDDDLVEMAVEAGASEDEVRAGIEGLSERKWAEDATQEAQDAGVTGTPTVLLDGKVFQDGRTVEELARNLVSELE